MCDISAGVGDNAEATLGRLHAARFPRIAPGALAVFVMIGPAAAAPLERSVSSSRQFIVFGSERGLRAGICDLGERTKTSLLALLDQRDGWKTPIIVNVERRAANLPEAPPARLNFSQTGFGLKLQLEFTFDADARLDEIRRELLRVLLLEIMYRDAPDTPAGTAYVHPPSWLVEGLLALISDADSLPIAESVAALPSESKVLQLPEFLQQQPSLLESPSRAIYTAKAGALVLMLIRLPDGHARLARFIRKLPQNSSDPVADLRAQFGEIGEPEIAEQNWARALAALSEKRYGMLSCEETERTLTDVLALELGRRGDAAETYTLEEFPKFIRSAAMPRALQLLQQRLLVASGRANPLYGPLIAEYQRIAVALMRRKTYKIPERLARLRGDREQIKRLMSAIGDYMNWFEATQAQTASGAFADYMRAAETADNREPRRHDRISVYLDALEGELND